MPFFSDETSFKLAVTEPKKDQPSDGWVEYGQQNGYSLQSREIITDGKIIIAYREVALK